MHSSTFAFEDHNGREIAAYRWLPEREARGVVQIVHGMQEHAARYERAAEALAAVGYAVYACDLRGHGQTARGPEGVGRLGPGGWESVLKGVKRLADLAKREQAKRPLFLLGHSWGSFLAQAFAQRWGDELRGLVLSGTNGADPLVLPGLVLARLVVAVKGGETTAGILEKLSVGGLNKAFEPGPTGKEWLSRDTKEVRKYVDDPLCGAPFPNEFFLELVRLLRHTWRRANEKRIPKKLPVYLFAGAEDPVGKRGRGPRALARRYSRYGLGDVTVKLYEGGRHEMLNETNRREVVRDLITWLHRRTGPQTSR